MPQDVELGGLREHTIDPAAVYEITLHGAPPASLTARFPSIALSVLSVATVLSRRVVDPAEIDGCGRSALVHDLPYLRPPS
jgi:hypothetical protein